MKIALLGRTRELLNAGRMLIEHGHEITLVATARGENYYEVGPKEFEEFARNVGANYLYGSKINNIESIEILRDSDAEIALSINWPILLDANVCAAFPHGIINAHAGDLPRFRGNACPNWAILTGEKVLGLCLHQMEGGRLDSGPVFLRDYFNLTSNTYISEIYKWMANRIPYMFCELVNGIEKKEIKAVHQTLNTNEWLRCYPRRSDDARIDWREDAVSIHRLIRASSKPLDGAFSFLENKYRITIWRADLYNHPGDFLAVPGQLMMIIDNKPVFACGTGALVLTEYSIEEAEGISMLSSLRSRLI